jgi:hypothetical protein
MGFILKSHGAAAITALIIFIMLVWMSLFIGIGTSVADINRTSEMNTTVNISNSAPEVRSAVIPPFIDLEAYGNVTVQCNVSVYDYDNNIAGVNATLHYFLTGSHAADNANNHYTNASCTALSPQDYSMNFSCTFDVQYYANNGTWFCNATAVDLGAAVGYNQSNPGVVNPLIAILVPGTLDYGELAQGQISESKLANITNAGNRAVNISVEGWGVTQGDGLAMGCTYGDIPVQFERYNSTNETYNNMYQLSLSSTKIPKFNVGQRVSPVADSVNSTYWRLQIPPLSGGKCNGKILFTASDVVG